MRTVLGLAVILAACAAPPFELAADRSSYARGDTVTLRLRNNLLEGAKYNLCDPLIEPRLAGHAPLCTADQLDLPPLGIGSGSFSIPGIAEPGTYSLTVFVTRADDTQDPVATSITVVP